MIEYKFKIDKEACFAYWAQSLIKWVWYFNKKEAQYYLDISGSLTHDEQIVLQKLKKILKKEDTGFLWLWERYVGGKIANSNDHLEWENINKILKNKFEKIWQKESLKLLNWQKILQTSSYDKLNEIFLKVNDFFDVNIKTNKTITVKLFFYYNKNSHAGHAKKEFNDLIIINLSNLDTEHFDKVINTLAHETIHLIEYASPISDILLKNSYFKILKPQLFKNSLFNLFTNFFNLISMILTKRFNLLFVKEGPKWRHLFIESIISSMAGNLVSNSYINQKLLNQKNISKENYTIEFDFKKNKTKYNTQIKIIASQLVNITTEYLDNNKKIDKEYCDKVALIWLNLIKNK